VEHPFRWRVREDAPDASSIAQDHPLASGGALPARPDPPVGEAGGRRLVLALVALATTIVAILAAVAFVIGGASSPTLVLPGDGAPAQAVSRLLAGATPAGGTPAASPGDAAAGGGPADHPLVVDVAGAVRHPGVYRLAPGARVVDAVAAAGGYGPRVDVDAASRINLAAQLHDGEQIRVPSRDDALTAPSRAPAEVGGGEDPSPGRLVDINTATAAALDTLPGIGPATAAKIIAAREEAPFATVDELRSRGVLGEATFRKVRDLVSVGR
jgi:competence protein ComEA